ncbi:hypothetical protein NC651_000087 [Populus alba x Populus x berolinensis]|nr:hypothetical protein NC651_000087 [Populus alba x Populus x berolinensis]
MTKSLKQIYDTLAIGTSAEPLATTTTSIVTAIDFSKGNFQESSAFGNFFSEIFHLFASTPSGTNSLITILFNAKKFLFLFPFPRYYISIFFQAKTSRLRVSIFFRDSCVSFWLDCYLI